MPDELGIDVTGIDFHLSALFDSLFTTPFWSNLGLRLLSLFGLASHSDYPKRLNADKDEFRKICDKELKLLFQDAIIDNNIAKQIEKVLKQMVVDEFMKQRLDEIQQSFRQMNESFHSCIEIFRSAVDDREKYKAEIEQYNLRKDTIAEIKDATSAFMQTWQRIVDNLDESPEELAAVSTAG